MCRDSVTTTMVTTDPTTGTINNVSTPAKTVLTGISALNSPHLSAHNVKYDVVVHP